MGAHLCHKTTPVRIRVGERFELCLQVVSLGTKTLSEGSKTVKNNVRTTTDSGKDLKSSLALTIPLHVRDERVRWLKPESGK